MQQAIVTINGMTAPAHALVLSLFRLTLIDTAKRPSELLAQLGGLPRRWPFAAGCYATYRVNISSWGRPGTDGEVLVARYGVAAVTDAGREAAAAQLREHYAAGRLSLDEFQDRLDAVYRAQTTRELGMVTDSLPHEGVVIPPGAPWDSYRVGYPLDVAKMRAAMARAGRRIMLAFSIVTAASLLVLTLLITAFMVHGGVLGVVVGALLAIFAVGVAAVGALAWLARRLWRRHAWIEVAPLVAGQPWLSRVARMGRLLLTGHALWRLRTRLASRA